MRSKRNQKIKFLDYFKRTLFHNLKKKVILKLALEMYPRIEGSAEKNFGNDWCSKIL